ncbi:bifunctional [glutamine synthetase] adenylyltransferase/[glutamine synthetase]-adenylyl-L-tyrosine phosphorylase [Helcobacillus massiliensis]|uniref:bifunctional [glutamine synthetase] adenylyltransferase/[glutamine synthetase]-adenylyl-L-tyrosine phosphorylase n=1 Tax=Helcobacillus massiliensis TaxID=521392 RepID=UPI0021A5F69B|nr:bifunctional [glutamine synthetase] adenylyltransferase/[glutamine synthetase]-adenylyl-L-tyrosine phosphorylase [Helcobacillus massiliensis]MCT1557122.1 bifunctional [glutamine synthetase] adenylyltransferase/[glutamine synthetase]-adenylyl-L-tyrosine phosphorylase [Helcobacillus massiliensis]MCT2036143.1 bifunctional [glutamine synthetase] adenylyltransferase/[glutamine synthetase]-adenylyl-L-tyrosine phosphorylase [Helcobacillus massiliensis]MCT2331274.1 bifunctional [glutamine synthetase]
MLPTSAIQAIQENGPFNHAELARLGFVHTERSARFLADEDLAAVPPSLVRTIGTTADPDEATIALLRVGEAANRGEQRALFERVVGSEAGERLVQLLGVSAALGDFLTRHPERLALVEEEVLPMDSYRARLLKAIGADPDADMPVSSCTGQDGRDRIRIEYHDILCRIALADITAPDAADAQPDVSRRLSALAGASLDAALAQARAQVTDHDKVRLAVIAMGKTGAQELNYISDVDVIYAADAADDEVSADDVTAIGGALARELARVCADRTKEGALWQVDANLRPEGKDGELVRTIDSFAAYYTRWASSWEFQALLKARPAAGDAALGQRFVELVEPMVWQASTRDGFVEDTRAMRRRVVELIPKSEVNRNLKLGPGGLRDVEFTVQLLQMVHGRTDDSIHAPDTLSALAQLTDGGYVARDQAAELDRAYRLMRALEHRIQLHRLRRSQVVPTSPADVRRLSRAMDMNPQVFEKNLDAIRRRVKQLHEEIYYRPLLLTAASLSDGQVALTPASAQARLAAIGYRDAKRAGQHIEALTKGLSRRAAIQRQLLPSLLEWLADGIDPDLGLLAFRRLSDELGSTHWFLGMLRDSGVAAKRLTRVLASSKYVGNQLESVPGAARWLGRDADLEPRSGESIVAELDATMKRTDDAAELIDVLRHVRSREITRIALAHVTRVIDPSRVAEALTDLAAAVLQAALHIARLQAKQEGATDAPRVILTVIAMGSFGAGEMGYSSDADVQFVVEGPDDLTDSDLVAAGTTVVTHLQKILNAPSSGIDMKVNADLRPEGRSGALVRTLASFSDYYRQHAERWEKQALLRAAPLVGPEETKAQVVQVLDEVRYPSEGLTPSAARELARMKARIESERLPRAARATHHLKLGPGAMTDVEWVVQKLQTEYAHENEQLRTTSTLTALEVLAADGTLPRTDADTLSQAWRMAWQLRRALFLWKGRETDVLPGDAHELAALAGLITGSEESAREMMDRYLKLTRRARSVTERELFGE